VSFWIEVLHDLSNPFEVRNEAAKHLAKYLHKAQPVITETNIGVNSENIGGFNINVIPPRGEE
jgi:hypothetical protein